MQTRGDGERARSLKVRGEEICEKREDWVNGRSCEISGEPTYLVGCVADTDVKIWKISLHHVPKHDLQSFLLGLSLHSLRDFSSHAWIQLHCYDSFGFLKYPDSQIACSGADFEDNLRGVSECCRVLVEKY